MRVVFSGGVVAGCEAEAGVFQLLEKIRQKVIDFPPRHTPLRSQTAGVENMCLAQKPGEPAPHLNAAATPTEPVRPWLSLSLSLSRSPSHLCLCGAAAAQRTEGAAFTSEHISHQMSPFAASPSNIRADNAPCILNI